MLHDGKSWKVIAEMVPGRDHTQCLQRWSKCLAPGLRKGTWLPHEDQKLKECVRFHQSSIAQSDQPNKKVPWGEVCKVIPGRTAKQCRERWVNNLDPSINKGPWTPQEDQMMIQLHAEIGPCWAAIAKRITGRTENGVKIRWKSLMRTRGVIDEFALPPAPAKVSASPAGSSPQVRPSKRSSAASVDLSTAYVNQGLSHGLSQVAMSGKPQHHLGVPAAPMFSSFGDGMMDLSNPWMLHQQQQQQQPQHHHHHPLRQGGGGGSYGALHPMDASLFSVPNFSRTDTGTSGFGLARNHTDSASSSMSSGSKSGESLLSGLSLSDLSGIQPPPSMYQFNATGPNLFPYGQPQAFRPEPVKAPLNPHWYPPYPYMGAPGMGAQPAMAPGLQYPQLGSTSSFSLGSQGLSSSQGGLGSAFTDMWQYPQKLPQQPPLQPQPQPQPQQPSAPAEGEAAN